MTVHPTPVVQRLPKARALNQHEARIELVSRTLTEHSKLSADEARLLAQQVLRAIDTVPERVR